MLMAYIALHYGKDYVGYAIKSVYDQVDKIVIFYTQTPSYGHREDVRCPETEEELRKVIYDCDPDNKIVWMKGWYGNEGQHRNSAEQFAESMGYDIVMALDYDEIWDKEELIKAIEFVKNSPYKTYRVPMMHFWRSFNWVCKDLLQPMRFTKFSGEGEGYIPVEPVYHFGYAITDEMMKYKWTCHGHKSELREDWFNEKWNKNAKIDVHPTNLDFWNVEKFDKKELPKFMREHPFYNKEII